jgi:hypothetical protein
MTTKSEIQFQSMTPAQKRVLIARDALTLLEGARILPTSGNYITRVRPLVSPDVQLQEVIKTNWLAYEHSCSACALGMTLIAACLRFNDLTVGELYDDGSRVSRAPVVEYLKRFFDADQLDLIEIAFEEGDVPTVLESTKLTPNEVMDAIVFGERFEGWREVMRAILNNIIQNEGVFVPSKTT